MRDRWILTGAALFAMAWAIARAAVQSITIDEAVSYNTFVFSHRYLWYAANNHILNSTLMYGFTRVFGLSHFTARWPALIGAAFYITAAYRMCRLLDASMFVRLTVFVCLVYNPFIFDHLVAARGYGLALGFLLWALVYAAESYLDNRSLVLACAVASLCCGMSINANFAFAFVDTAAMTAILVCAWRLRPKLWIRLLAAGILPAAAVLAVVSGYALLHLHGDELVYGAHSLADTFGSIVASSLFRNDLVFLKPLVLPAVGLTGLAWLSYLFAARVKSTVAIFGWVAAAIFVSAVALHWIAFRVFGLPLPNDRTGIFFFPLFMIVLSVLAAIPAPSAIGRCLRAGFLAALAMMAVYFLLCLRMTYFKEWYWDSDVNRTYAVLTCLNREQQLSYVASAWPYRGPLNFYQIAQPTSLQDIDEKFDPRQTQVYVVDMLHTSDVLQGKDLKIFYRSPTTDLVLAASPRLAGAYGASACVR